MTLNPHVNVDTEYSPYADRFTPDEGYALWRDNETGNLDENGNPMCYWLIMNIQKKVSESYAPHIWAKLIDDTMDVYGTPSTPPVVTASAEDYQNALRDMGVKV